MTTPAVPSPSGSPDDPAGEGPGAAPARRPRGGDPGPLLDAATKGDRVALARLLTLVEGGGAPGRAVAALAYRSGREAQTVGITGPPGAGKSTLVDRLIATARAKGVAQLGVLAVDPSSPFTGGAILGDRVRMQDHALDAGVFIRSMASRGHLGGLAVAVPEAIRTLAAAGFPLVLVETVGVGQVEVEVAGATDTTVVVLNPRWGDAVQANKAGLLETADLFVINKADMPGARETRRDLEQMLDLTALGDWRPPVLETSASTGEGVDELWEEIARHERHLEEHGALEARRAARLEREFRIVLAARIRSEVDRLSTDGEFAGLARAVAEHRLDPYEAADRLLGAVYGGAPGD
ncbi:MAG TPA: methylmalonyl Co-A mutase-associated GTPase MeaB [Acidimicrobiales bacterium]|nr:methylmalonyl Co-A mutase-associated GTPase MeaB [Acidimicrobiales bacterium]HLN41358.1 methylmalonyl Co-A mutase-associated GTPase MeaB [Acidimicrobiales bacterium]